MNNNGGKQTIVATAMRVLALLLLAGAISTCSRPAVIKLGFVAGLSGRAADLGGSGLNGVVLAVEQRNASGGIHGLPVELVVRDDAQDAETAKRVVGELLEQNVVAIIGHMTSNMSMATVPLVNERKVLMISPTTTTNKLTGKDDYFFRVINSTRAYATRSAQYFRNDLKWSRVALAYDRDNYAYSQSWMNDFRSAFEFEGGKVIGVMPFVAGHQSNFRELAQTLLQGKPDAIVLVASAIDAALLSRQIRAVDSRVMLATSEWASTEQLVELGGKAVEGIYQAQFIDRFSTQPAYRDFQQSYLKRFGKEPGYAGVAAHDAASVVLEALARRKDGDTLRETILNIGTFEGLQEPIVFDAYGEAVRRNYITVIRNGQFRVIGP